MAVLSEQTPMGRHQWRWGAFCLCPSLLSSMDDFISFSHFSDLMLADKRCTNRLRSTKVQWVVSLLCLQWSTVTYWTAVLRRSPWPPVKSVWTSALTSPCWRPTQSSHRCRSLQAWEAWPSSQRGCLCFTLTSFSRWDQSLLRHDSSYRHKWNILL